MNDLTQRVVFLSHQGVPVDVMTHAFRAEGFPDESIRAAFEEVFYSGDFDVVVDRQIPMFVPRT